ncbi:hypothetical protein [Paracoccus sp. MC1862]|uniref:hypothetical protein n=1 Tax=Paracoccus sp. MC1862 TaxID=2760307 RepID=UPI0015FF9C07|nr:hypothetical protein [Paracoccus sp. MC1862]MBB1498542.1 hypothetical protein [Paracoccus sp. MC1862]QQO43886.1 hypothetical protein JGR78_10670 [Paracoccus sp. MC1862]
MSRWLEAARLARKPKAKTDETDETPAKVEGAGQAAQHQPVLSVVSVSSVGRERETAPVCAPPAPSAPAVPVHGGMVATWCGVWVSREQWDALSDMDRHGPKGRLFCGKCWQWQDRDTALACLSGRPCA